MLISFNACTPAEQSGLGSGRPDPGGRTTIDNDNVAVDPGDSDGLDARLAACDLTADESQDLELCSQVLNDSGKWLNTCQDSVKIPCGTLMDERCERREEPRNDRGRRRHAKFCNLREQRIRGFIENLRDTQEKFDPSEDFQAAIASFQDKHCANFAFLCRNSNGGITPETGLLVTGLNPGSLNGLGDGIDPDSSPAEGTCSVDPDRALSCLEAVRDETFDDCSARIQEDCRPSQITLCTMGIQSPIFRSVANGAVMSFCSQLLQSLAQNDRDAQPLPPPVAPAVQEAVTVRSLTVKIRTASMRSAGTDASIKLYACPRGKSDAEIRNATNAALSGRGFDCIGADIESSGQLLETNKLNLYNLNLQGEKSGFETFILDWTARGRYPGWVVGGLQISAALSNGRTEVLYANACLETQLDAQNKRLILRRTDIAACVLTGVLGTPSDSMSTDAVVGMSFKVENQEQPEHLLDKPAVDDEFENDRFNNPQRFNSFGIPRVTSNGLISSIEGFRFDFANLKYRERDGRPNPAQMNTRVLLFKPGQKGTPCKATTPDTLEVLACKENEDGRSTTENCGRIPLVRKEFLPMREQTAAGDTLTCQALYDVDRYGDINRSWSGFHNLSDRDGTLQNRMRAR